MRRCPGIPIGREDDSQGLRTTAERPVLPEGGLQRPVMLGHHNRCLPGRHSCALHTCTVCAALRGSRLDCTSIARATWRACTVLSPGLARLGSLTASKPCPSLAWQGALTQAGRCSPANPRPQLPPGSRIRRFSLPVVLTRFPAAGVGRLEGMMIRTAEYPFYPWGPYQHDGVSLESSRACGLRGGPLPI